MNLLQISPMSKSQNILLCCCCNTSSVDGAAIADGGLASKDYYAAFISAMHERGYAVTQVECPLLALELATEYSAMGGGADVCHLAIWTENSILPLSEMLRIRNQVSALADVPVVAVAETVEQALECLRLGADDVVIRASDTEELELRVAAILRRKERRGLVGSFAHLTLFEVIQVCLQYGKSGYLFTESYDNQGDNQGHLVFSKGQLIFARDYGEEGEEAFVNLVKSAKRGGTFTLQLRSVDSVTPNIHKPTDHLLLEVANNLDETLAE